MIGDREQLFLDALDRRSRGAAAGEGVVDVDGVEFQAHRERSGEPADRVGQVCSGHGLLLATVPLEGHQDEIGIAPAIAAPAGDGEGQRGEQAVVDRTVDDRGKATENALDDGALELDPQVRNGGDGVEFWVEGPRSQYRIGVGENALPQRQFGEPARRRIRQPGCPAPETRSLRGQFDGCTVGDAVPREREVWEQCPPGHPVDDEVVCDDEEPARHVTGQIEPHEPDGDAALDVEIGCSTAQVLLRKGGERVGSRKRVGADPGE